MFGIKPVMRKEAHMQQSCYADVGYASVLDLGPPGETIRRKMSRHCNSNLSHNP
jgi:hypothetical protein